MTQWFVNYGEMLLIRVLQMHYYIEAQVPDRKELIYYGDGQI